jgi:hypothetical protein
MSNHNPQSADNAMETLRQSAQRLGIELDEAEALQWLTAMAAEEGQEGIAYNERSGVFGHKVAMLDFSEAELERFRQIGRLVEFQDEPGVVETALAISGSSAQSKVQTYPGDMDFFERLNILAPDREEACRILARLMREKALSSRRGPTHQLIQVRFGNYPITVLREGKTCKAGCSVTWTVDEVQAGQVEAALLDGTAVSVQWEDVAMDPGWCKLDWVVADRIRGGLSNASNMLDVTWEAPDGRIVPLDGYLDAYFQEVYLDATSIPIFAKLAQHVSADALDNYVEQLEKEVKKYVSGDPANYGKAAKRMYNVFRLTGRYEEAAFLRELFDEPAAMLYQVWSLIRTVEEASNPDSPISMEDALSQTDQLILATVQALEGAEEGEIVRRMLRFRDALTHQHSNEGLDAQATAAQAEVINVVNNFFYEKLTAMPGIQNYIEGMK